MRLVVGRGAALSESIRNGGGLCGETIIGGTGREAPRGPVGREVDRGRGQGTPIARVEVAVGGADAIHGGDDVAIGVITRVDRDGALRRIAAIAVGRDGRCHARYRRGCSRRGPLVVHKVFALPDMGDGAAAVETIHFAVCDLVDSVIAGGVRGGIRPLLLHRRPVGTGDLFALQVVIAVAQAGAQTVIIIGVISLDPRRGSKAPTFHVRGFRRDGRNQAGDIGDIEITIARTGRGVIAGIGGFGLLQQRSRTAVAAVDVLLVQLARVEVAAIAAAGGPAFGAEVGILGQVARWAGDIDNVEAAKLGVVEVLPVAVLPPAIGGGNVVVAHAILIAVLAVLVGITEIGILAVVAARRFGEAIGIGGNGGGLGEAAAGAAVGADGSDLRHDLHAPHLVVGVVIVRAAAAVAGMQGTVERIIAIIGDGTLLVFDGGRAMRVVVGKGIGDESAHAGVAVQVTGQVEPVRLHTILTPFLIGVQDVEVRVFQLL